MQKTETLNVCRLLHTLVGRSSFKQTQQGSRSRLCVQPTDPFLTSALQFGYKLLNVVLKILYILLDLFSVDFVSITL